MNHLVCLILCIATTVPLLPSTAEALHTITAPTYTWNTPNNSNYSQEIPTQHNKRFSVTFEANPASDLSIGVAHASNTLVECIVGCENNTRSVVRINVHSDQGTAQQERFFYAATLPRPKEFSSFLFTVTITATTFVASLSILDPDSHIYSELIHCSEADLLPGTLTEQTLSSGYTMLGFATRQNSYTVKNVKITDAQPLPKPNATQNGDTLMVTAPACSWDDGSFVKNATLTIPTAFSKNFCCTFDADPVMDLGIALYSKTYQRIIAPDKTTVIARGVVPTELTAPAYYPLSAVVETIIGAQNNTGAYTTFESYNNRTGYTQKSALTPEKIPTPKTVCRYRYVVQTTDTTMDISLSYLDPKSNEYVDLLSITDAMLKAATPAGAGSLHDTLTSTHFSGFTYLGFFTTVPFKISNYWITASKKAPVLTSAQKKQLDDARTALTTALPIAQETASNAPSPSAQQTLSFIKTALTALPDATHVYKNEKEIENTLTSAQNAQVAAEIVTTSKGK